LLPDSGSFSLGKVALHDASARSQCQLATMHSGKTALLYKENSLPYPRIMPLHREASPLYHRVMPLLYDAMPLHREDPSPYHRVMLLLYDVMPLHRRATALSRNIVPFFYGLLELAWSGILR